MIRYWKILLPVPPCGIADSENNVFPIDRDRPPPAGLAHKQRWGQHRQTVTEAAAMRPYLAEIDLKAGKRVEVKPYKEYE